MKAMTILELVNEEILKLYVEHQKWTLELFKNRMQYLGFLKGWLDSLPCETADKVMHNNISLDNYIRNCLNDEIVESKEKRKAISMRHFAIGYMAAISCGNKWSHELETSIDEAIECNKEYFYNKEKLTYTLPRDIEVYEKIREREGIDEEIAKIRERWTL